jgi:hypothetical protein
LCSLAISVLQYGTMEFWLTFNPSYEYFPIPEHMLVSEKEKEEEAFKMTERQSIIAGKIRTVMTQEALEDFYSVHAPEKITDVPELLGRYDHAELVLLLQGKYNDSPPVWEVPELQADVWEEHLQDHVQEEWEDEYDEEETRFDGEEGVGAITLSLEALQNFYSQYAPEKVADAEIILTNVQGQELVLIEALKSQYGAAPEHSFASTERRHSAFATGPAAPEIHLVITLDALREFYSHHAPDKVRDCAAILRTCRGKEAEMVEALEEKYGAVPAATLAKAPSKVHVVVTVDALQDFYSVHATDKINDAAEILYNLTGQEAEMVEALREKYGDVPVHTTVVLDDKERLEVRAARAKSNAQRYNGHRITEGDDFGFSNPLAMGGGNPMLSAKGSRPSILPVDTNGFDGDGADRPLSPATEYNFITHAQMDRPLVPKGFRASTKKKKNQAQVKKPGQGLEARASYANIKAEREMGRPSRKSLEAGRPRTSLMAKGGRKSRKPAGGVKQKKRNSIILKPKPDGKQFETENLLFRQVVGVAETGAESASAARSSLAGSVGVTWAAEQGEWSNALFAVDEGQLLKFGVSAASPDRIWSLFEKDLAVDFSSSSTTAEAEDSAEGGENAEGGDEEDASFGYRNPMANNSVPNRKGTTDENFQFEISDAGLSDLTIRFMATSVEQKWAWVHRIRCGIKFAQIQHLAQLHADTALETAKAAIEQVEEEADPEERVKADMRRQFRGSVTKVITANRFKTDIKAEAAAVDAERMQVELDAAVSSAGGSAEGAVQGAGGAAEDEDEDEDEEDVTMDERKFEAAVVIGACWRGGGTRMKAGFNIKMLRHRLRVSLELLETERTYNHGLKNVVEVVVTPLKWKAEHSGTPVLSLQDISTVFCNVVQLQELSTMLLKSMQEVMDNAHTVEQKTDYSMLDGEGAEFKKQRASQIASSGANSGGKGNKKKRGSQIHRLSTVLGSKFARFGGKNVNSMAKVFLHYGPFFNLYSEYLRNYGKANVRLQQLMDEGEGETGRLIEQQLNGFIDTLQEVHPDWHGKSLQHFLIMPVQRIPRYVLLLRDLLKHTPSMSASVTAGALERGVAADTHPHPHHVDLKKALEMMEKIAAQCDMAIGSSVRPGVGAAPMVSGKYRALVAQKPMGTTAASIQNCQMWFGAFVDIMLPHREALYAGPLVSQTSEGLSKVWCFLFNDLLLLATEQKRAAAAHLTTVGLGSSAGAARDFQYVDHMKIDGFMLARALEDLPSLERKAIFRTMNDGKVFTLRSATEESRDAWVSAIAILALPPPTEATNVSVGRRGSANRRGSVRRGSVNANRRGSVNGARGSVSGGTNGREEKVMPSQAGGTRTSVGRRSTIHRRSYSASISLGQYIATTVQVDVVAVAKVSPERAEELANGGEVPYVTQVLRDAEAERVSTAEKGVEGGEDEGAGALNLPSHDPALVESKSSDSSQGGSPRSAKRLSVTNGQRSSLGSMGRRTTHADSVSSERGDGSRSRGFTLSSMLKGSGRNRGNSRLRSGSTRGSVSNQRVVEYTIQLTLPSRSWTVGKTFEQIEQLRADLIKCFPTNAHNVPKLPQAKTGTLFVRQNPTTMRKQAAALSHFLQQLAVDPELRGQKALRSFYRMDEYESLDMGSTHFADYMASENGFSNPLVSSQRLSSAGGFTKPPMVSIDSQPDIRQQF